MADTIKVQSFEECLDALIQDIKDDREKIKRMYGGKEESITAKGYTRSIMLVEEAKKRWLKDIKEGIFE